MGGSPQSTRGRGLRAWRRPRGRSAGKVALGAAAVAV